MKSQEKLRHWLIRLQKYADHWWYAPLMGLLAGADLFLVVIPTDGLLISAVMLAPRRWIYTAFMVTLGSSLGTLALGYLLQQHGLPLLLNIVPGIDQSSAWVWTKSLMDSWGPWAVFVVALSPLMQHPAVALAALAGMTLLNLFALVFAGRILKYLMLSYIATHAPAMLGRLWGIQDELGEVGVKNPKDQAICEPKPPRP
jgi:membrane protein YqaA with SNARE-associated domain